MAERVLLTGATGFVGRAALAPLAAGWEVHAVTSRAVVPPDGGGVTWQQADLLDLAAARRLVAAVRPAVLVHAAWYVEHGRFWSAPENQSWLEASTALAAYVAEAGGRRILGIGSCAEYADEAEGDGAPWPETRPLAPATPYGRAKAALAARLADLAQQHATFQWSWARLFHLFGPGEDPRRLVSSVFRAVLRGEEAACASGRPVRDFASTWHVGDALAALARSDVTGPVNIGSGRAMTIADLVGLIGRLTGRSDLIRLGRLPDRPGEAPYVVADTTRLVREVGLHAPAATERDLARLLTELRAAGAAGAQPANAPASCSASDAASVTPIDHSRRTCGTSPAPASRGDEEGPPCMSSSASTPPIPESCRPG